MVRCATPPRSLVPMHYVPTRDSDLRALPSFGVGALGASLLPLLADGGRYVRVVETPTHSSCVPRPLDRRVAAAAARGAPPVLYCTVL